MAMKNRKKNRVDINFRHVDEDLYKKEGKYIKNIFLVFCCIFVAFSNFYHASHMQENHIMFSHLSTIEREMSFRTEMGFYYSFYKQVIEAPSLIDSIHLLTSDNLTEHPSTINSLTRFNIYPELIIGALYRLFIYCSENLIGIDNIRTCYSINRHNLPPVESCEGLGEPAVFYVHMVMVLNGAVMAFLFLAAYKVSGNSLLGAAVSSLFFFFNHRECTRVQWTPPLRESFSYPFIMAQQWFLMNILTHPLASSSKIYVVSKFGFFFTTLFALLSWQFAQFAFLTQSVAVYLTYIVAGDTCTKNVTRKILLLLLAADCLNFVLQFGNSLLLVGPLRPCIIMALILITVEPLSLRRRFQNSPLAPLRWFVLIIVLLFSTFLLKYLIGVTMQIKSDDHMFDILRSKFSNFRSFDSMLYTCAPEFDFYDMSSLLELSYTGLLPISFSAMLIIVIYSLYKWYQLFCISSDNIKEDETNFLTKSGFCTIDTYYLLFQTIAYTIMAALIMRLKLFWTPQLCIFAAFITNERWPLASVIDHVFGKWPLFRNKIIRFTLPIVLIVALCSVKGFSNIKSEWSIKGAYSNWDQEQLLGFISDRTQPHDAFVGQMATMATVRLVTGRPITMHPHYEDEHLRKRVRMSYAIYSRKSVHDVWFLFRSELQATYFIYEQAYCSLRLKKPGCSYLEMWDMVEPFSRKGESLCELFNNYVADMRLGHNPGSGGISRYFKWRFTSDSGTYTLFEIVSLPLS